MSSTYIKLEDHANMVCIGLGVSVRKVTVKARGRKAETNKDTIKKVIHCELFANIETGVVYSDVLISGAKVAHALRQSVKADRQTQSGDKTDGKAKRPEFFFRVAATNVPGYDGPAIETVAVDDADSAAAEAWMDANTMIDHYTGYWRYTGGSYDPSHYIERPGGGFRTSRMEDTVRGEITVATGPGRSLWTFDSGVWVQGGEDRVAGVVRRALGDEFRPSHANTVTEAMIVSPAFTIDPDEAVTQYINFRNGLLDWRSGELIGYDELIPTVNQIPHAWDEFAICPEVDDFLRSVLIPRDADRDTAQEYAAAVDTVYEIIGAILYDGNDFQSAALFRGGGGNGKGALIRLIIAVVGAENISSVTLQGLSDNRFAAAEMYGKMVNIAGDLDPTMLKNTALFKGITGGDTLFAERKFGQPFKFKARALPVFSANETIRTSDTPDGYFRRWLTIPFPNKYEGEDMTPQDELDRLLAKEAQGVLVKAVEGLQRLYTQGGFTQTPAMITLKTDERRKADPVRAFVVDQMVYTKKGRVNRRDVYKRYKAWALEQGMYALASTKFYERFPQAMHAEHGRPLRSPELRKIRGLYYWEAAGINPDAELPEGLL